MEWIAVGCFLGILGLLLEPCTAAFKRRMAKTKKPEVVLQDSWWCPVCGHEALVYKDHDNPDGVMILNYTGDGGGKVYLCKRCYMQWLNDNIPEMVRDLKLHRDTEKEVIH